MQTVSKKSMCQQMHLMMSVSIQTKEAPWLCQMFSLRLVWLVNYYHFALQRFTLTIFCVKL